MTLLHLLFSIRSWSELCVLLRASWGYTLATLAGGLHRACASSYAAYLALSLFVLVPFGLLRLVAAGVGNFCSTLYCEVVRERVLTRRVWRSNFREPR